MVETALTTSATAQAHPAIEQIWEWLRDVRDPEIPVLSVVDLGIVREVAWNDDSQTCTVTTTPTYSGCPATAVIHSNIREELAKHGIRDVQVPIQLSPPWTTDWLSPAARIALRTFGIAPPGGPAPQRSAAIVSISALVTPLQSPTCPRCGSARTSAISQFGSTLCKSLYRCRDCCEPFEHFKPH